MEGARRGLVHSADLIFLCLLLSAFTVLGPVYDKHLEDSPATRRKTESMLGRLPSLGTVQAQGASVQKQKMLSQQVSIKELTAHKVPPKRHSAQQRNHVCSRRTISKSAS